MSDARLASVGPAALARRSRSSFLVSFAFLRPRRRRGITAIYAFCRAVDDAVDEAPDAVEGRARLAAWRSELERILAGAEPATEIGRALQRTVREFGVAGAHLRAVVDGVAMDLELRAYPDLDALEASCARVASAVGLACLPVFGVDTSRAERYADRLGRALQIVNILRDLRSDAERGRVYAPATVLEATGVRPEWLRGDGPPEVYADGGPVHRLVEQLATVAQTRFAEADEALPRESAVRRRLLAAEIMSAVYGSLLARVRARRGRLDHAGRLRVPTSQKLALALRTWVKGRRP